MRSFVSRAGLRCCSRSSLINRSVQTVPRVNVSSIRNGIRARLGPSQSFGSRIRLLRGNDTINSSNSNAELQRFRENFALPERTCEIKDLDKASIGDEVILHGYLGSRADLSKKLSFAPLQSQDLRHSVQIISLASKDAASDRDCHEQFKFYSPHSPIAVRGVIKARKPSKDRQQSEIEHNNEVELDLREIWPLGEFPRDLEMTPETKFPASQRHLQIRNVRPIRDALCFRAEAMQICRDQLVKQDFLEIETPLLFKSTPEGAREFLVPTRDKGLVYALPQSPQQYKQILMASGIPRYYQFARCFRDEDQRADRQPEFTQLDLEMSFAKGEQVMQLVEKMLVRLWRDLLEFTVDEPFQRMTYENAMSKYGSDKPDLRLGMEMANIGELLPVDLISKIGPLTRPDVDVFKLSVSDDPRETKKFISEFLDSADGAPFLANPDGQPGIFVYNSRQPLGGLQPFGFQAAEYVEELFGLEDGDLLVIQARPRGAFTGGFTMAGRLRLALHRTAVAQGLITAPKGYKFLWVTDFPLFTPDADDGSGQGGGAGLASTHHPFTSPKTLDDIELLATDPTAAKADHYDIVVNGIELGGGSRRIHDAKAQEYILREVLKMPEERVADFRHLIDVLRAGCPPHAGIALGFDRLIAVMLGKESIRDVMAFPKSGKGEDHLVKSPSLVTEKQLETYHLHLKV